MYRAGGLPRVDGRTGKVLFALSKAGLFRLRAVVGTHAFRCYPGLPGVDMLETRAITEDIDIAAFRSIPPWRRRCGGSAHSSPVRAFTDSRPHGATERAGPWWRCSRPTKDGTVTSRCRCPLMRRRSAFSTIRSTGRRRRRRSTDRVCSSTFRSQRATRYTSSSSRRDGRPRRPPRRRRTSSSRPRRPASSRRTAPTSWRRPCRKPATVGRSGAPISTAESGVCPTIRDRRSWGGRVDIVIVEGSLATRSPTILRVADVEVPPVSRFQTISISWEVTTLGRNLRCAAKYWEGTALVRKLLRCTTNRDRELKVFVFRIRICFFEPCRYVWGVLMLHENTMDFHALFPQILYHR